MARIAIIGTGVIGTGWVARLLVNGHQVKAWDPSEGFGKKLKKDIDSLWPILKKTGRMNDELKFNLKICDTLGDACKDANLIQESAPEDIDIKMSVHHDIEEKSPTDALIVSSSSGLLPTNLQEGLKYPERFAVGHPFNPVYILPLVEIVGGKKTSQSTIKFLRDFYESIKMHPLIVRNEIEGYLSDRLQEAQWREILHLVNDDVATTRELDEAIIYGPGLRWAIMGTCLTFHLAGGETGMRHMLEQFGPALELPWTKLKAPELTDNLIEKMVSGTSEQAGEKSVKELEKLRDECLIEILQALKKFNVGAGRYIKS
tara:strand:+ start:1726 stop:2673 length:948 start_codon:yes stop_codon:yes gene_type:complete